jgi:prephenate dehydrogenase
MRLQDCRITIVGLGLMGGSLAMALRERIRPHRGVWGVSRQPRTMHQALIRNVVDFATLDLAEGVREADLVILATPVRTIIEMIGQVGPQLAPGAVLLDLGSTKADIVEAMARLPAHVQPLGGHPMCGKEVAGLDAAEATLYDGAVFVLTPLARTKGEALDLARQLATAVGARPLVMEAERHDRLVATISHLPYALAVALVGVAEEAGQEDELVWELAASGFRDTSRLAASELTMMLDILLTNRRSVAETLRRARGRLEALAALLEAGDEAALREVLGAAQARRQTLSRRGVGQ